MTWTHNIIGIEIQNGSLLRILVDYLDSTDENNILHDSLYVNASAYNLEWLKYQIQSKLNQLNLVDTFDVPTGEIDLTPASVLTATTKYSSAQSSIASGGSADSIYTVTTGKKLTISAFTAGAAATSSALQNHVEGAKIELFYDPSGNGTGMTLIDVIYCLGASVKFVENFTTDTGNGTIAVRVRRTNFAAVANEIYGKWDGSEI